MIITFIASLALVFGLGFITGKGTDSHSDWRCPNLDYEKERKYSALETRVFVLEKENERFNYIIKRHDLLKRNFEENYYAHCKWCEKNFYAKIPQEQCITDLLKQNMLNVEELAKKLDIKID